MGFLAATAVLLAQPLLTQLGGPGLWVLLPFLLAALAAVWIAIERSYRDAEIVEELTLTRESIVLTHRKGRAAPQEWSGNPFWTRPVLHPEGGPVPQYLTLQGSGREVEVGAFLSEGERIALCDELSSRLQRLRRPD